MAVDIVVTVNGQIPRYDLQNSISFNDDADYWFLWPTMIKEIEDRTGQLIDLYGDAKFSGDFLGQVEKILLRHLEELNQRSDPQWEVHVGTQTEPVKKEIYKTLIKKDLEEKLQRFASFLRYAAQANEKVICLGD